MAIPFSSHELIRQLGMVPHEEGGFYRPIFPPSEAHPGRAAFDAHAPAFYSSMFYMLTAEHPLGYLHVNRADIVHSFHAGSPLTYVLIFPDGRLVRRTLGPDLHAGQELQLIVPGGTWKATILETGNFGLISEVAVPAFDRRDREFATPERIQRLFPSLWPELASFVRKQAIAPDRT